MSASPFTTSASRYLFNSKSSFDLRQQLGHSPATVLRLPQPLTTLSARLGDAVPQSPWCSETLAMLGSDNVGNPAVFEQLLGRKGVHFSQLVATAWC